MHDWIKSTLGHGETMCSRCFITNREAAALGCSNFCDVPAPAPKPTNDNVVVLPVVRVERDSDDTAEDLPFICPVTCQPCTTDQDEFCEDYGCARKAGIDVDRDLIL
jgi:hypothetical protein